MPPKKPPPKQHTAQQNNNANPIDEQPAANPAVLPPVALEGDPHPLPTAETDPVPGPEPGQNPVFVPNGLWASSPLTFRSGSGSCAREAPAEPGRRGTTSEDVGKTWSMTRNYPVQSR